MPRRKRTVDLNTLVPFGRINAEDIETYERSLPRFVGNLNGVWDDQIKFECCICGSTFPPPDNIATFTSTTTGLTGVLCPACVERHFNE